MSLIKVAGLKAVYANANTIWNGLFGIKDGDGKKLFVQDSTSDPLVQGHLYGAAVKQDDNLADNVAYFIVPAGLLANNFDELEIGTAVDPYTLNKIVTGYSCFDAGLENPQGAVKVTFKAAA